MKPFFVCYVVANQKAFTTSEICNMIIEIEQSDRIENSESFLNSVTEQICWYDKETDIRIISISELPF